MNSTNIWKKNCKSKSSKRLNGIVNNQNFKSKKKKYFSNILKENFITNWIENEGDDEQSESSTDLDKFIVKCQINDSEEDSLQLENLERLSTMKNIIFLDLDNFSRFFQHLTNYLPNYTYIIAFQGSHIRWKPPKKFPQLLFFYYFQFVYSSDFVYEHLLSLNNFQLMRPSGTRHDAADFALVLTFGKLHGQLPKCIPFTIVSGDKGFIEIIHQLKNSDRRINWFNPHQISIDNFYQILNITSQTTYK